MISIIQKKYCEIYVSTDIETDGPVAGLNSMLSFGSAAYSEDGVLIDTFTANLEALRGSACNAATMQWWETQPAAWQACRQNLQFAGFVMPRYYDWLKELEGNLIFVGYPVVFDFKFIDYYFHKFIGFNPFKNNTIDIRSYAMGMSGRNYYKSGKRSLLKKWKEKDLRHTHIALDDAIEQGKLFCSILKYRSDMVSLAKIK